MNNGPIEVKATVERIVRINGKTAAQMVVTIPLSDSVNIPLGAVKMSVQALQSSLFGKDAQAKDAKENKKNK